MAVINKMRNEYINVESITLRVGTDLNMGFIGNSGSISGLIVSTSTLLTVPTPRTYLITEIIFNMLDNTGLTGAMVASIGTNSATYNNIMPSTTFTGFNQLNQIYSYHPTGVVYKPSNGDVITLNLTTAYGGGSVLFDVSFYGVII